jgi:transcriptional regulator with XRE-family HTH domain
MQKANRSVRPKIDTDLASKLKALGWRKVDLARKAGMWSRTVSEWAGGHTKTPPVIIAYLDAMIELQAIHVDALALAKRAAITNPTRPKRKSHKPKLDAMHTTQPPSAPSLPASPSPLPSKTPAAAAKAVAVAVAKAPPAREVRSISKDYPGGGGKHKKPPARQAPQPLEEFEDDAAF